MADSNALRQRRWRWHNSGDHSLCLPGKCPHAGPASAASMSPPLPASPKRAVKRLDATLPKPTVPEFPPAVPPEIPEGEGPRVPGGIEQAVSAFVEALPFAAGDPRALLGTICIRIAQRVDETGAMPAAVRELRTMLAQIAEVPNQPAGAVDQARYHRALRRLDGILAGL